MVTRARSLLASPLRRAPAGPLTAAEQAVTDAKPITHDVLHPPLANLDDGEQLLFQARPDLAATLAGGIAVDRAAAHWAETDEMRADRYTQADCVRVLTGLAALAAQAAADGRALFTWLRL